MIRLNNAHTVDFEARFAKIEKKENQYNSIKSCNELKKFLPVAIAFLKADENHRYSEDVAHYLMNLKAYLPDGLAEPGPPISDSVKTELYGLLMTHRYTSGFFGIFGKAEAPEKTIAKLEALNAHLNTSDIVATGPETELTVPLNTDAEPLSTKEEYELFQLNQLALTPEEKLACASADLTPSQSQKMVELFRNANVPLNINTIPRHFHDDNLIGEMEQLGTGVFNTVYSAVYKGIAGGPPTKVVFKPEGYKLGLGAHVSGIDEANPQFGLRNVAVYKLSTTLNFDVIPKTEFAIHKGKLGIMMKLVPGEPAGDGWVHEDVSETKLGMHLLKNREAMGDRNSAKFKSALKVLGLQSIIFPEDGGVEVIYSEPLPHIADLYADKRVLWKLNELQWLDVLSAQSDRHDGNIIGDGNGIDNDQTFGWKIRKISELRDEMGEYAFIIGDLPEVASLETFNRFMALTDKQIQEAMLGLSPAEIESTIARLREIQACLTMLWNDKKIFGPSDLDEILKYPGSYVERSQKIPVGIESEPNGEGKIKPGSEEE